MRIAVASIGLDVAPSYSQCENYNYYTTQSYEIIASQNFPAQGVSADECATMMESMNVDVLVCDEIGDLTRSAFEAHDIKVIDSKKGKALQVAQELVEEMAEALIAGNDEDDED